MSCKATYNKEAISSKIKVCTVKTYTAIFSENLGKI